MNSKQVLFVFCSVLVAVTAKDYYGHYKDFEDCYEKSKSFCVGTEQCTTASPTTVTTTTAMTTSAPKSKPKSGSGSYEEAEVVTCPCTLMDYLFNVSISLQGTAYYEIYIQWIMEVQVEVLEVQSYSDDDKFRFVISSLKKLCKEHSEMESILKYQKIEGFGFFRDLMSVETEYQVESSFTQQLLVLNGQSCLLFDAFLNDASLTSVQISELQAMFADIRVNVLNGKYAYTDEVLLVYKRFHDLYKKHPDWEADFYNVTIDGFGCFGDWSDIGKSYQGVWLMQMQIGGSGDSCPFLQALLTYSQNVSIDIGVRLQVKNYHDAILAQFNQFSDVDTRLQIIMNITYQYEALEGFNFASLCDIDYKYSFDGDDYDQSLYDLFYQAFYKYKYGFTSSLSLPCDNYYESLLLTNDPNMNGQSPLVYSMYSVCNSTSWTIICRNVLKPVIGRCHNYITNMSANGSTAQQKASVVFNYLSQNPTNNLVCQQNLLQVVIKLSSGMAFGRVCDFASCTNQTGANLACS